MTLRFPKPEPRRRMPALYKQLHQQVLERDGWRCQYCGGRQNLHVHHLRARSQQGEDTEENLITLCARCHESIHRGMS
jgi:5-methylcytosine-specific restriction endonuclease McrA